MGIIGPWRGGSVGCPIYQKVAGLIPGQGAFVGCGFDPSLGHIQEAADQWFSLTSMSVCLSLPQINKNISGEYVKKWEEFGFGLEIRSLILDV